MKPSGTEGKVCRVSSTLWWPAGVRQLRSAVEEEPQRVTHTWAVYGSYTKRGNALEGIKQKKKKK